MKATFAGRRSWILNDTPTVSEVISVFPSLKLSSRVRTTVIAFGRVEAESRACVRTVVKELTEEEQSEGDICVI